MTTDVYYPDADTESTSVDGYTNASLVGTTWASARASAGTASSDNSVTGRVVALHADTTGWDDIGRGYFLFDTSSLPDTDTIDSAVVSIYGVSKTDNGQYDQKAVLITTNPASNTSLASTDHYRNSLVAGGGVDVGTARIDLGTWGNSAYNDFTVSDLTKISATGVTKFGLALSGDVDNAEPTIDNNGIYSDLTIRYADQTGTTEDPMLTVVHSVGEVPPDPVSSNVGDEWTFSSIFVTQLLWLGKFVFVLMMLLIPLSFVARMVNNKKVV